jgi:ISXO2-like transposase domain
MIYSDALKWYNDLNYDYMHNVINHAEKYVEGNVDTNRIENFWSLLKRTIGAYISVVPFHLFGYLDEQAFRFNRRKANDRIVSLKCFLWLSASVLNTKTSWAK